ncbi:hypothetical protein Q4595_19790, partial [Wenyingzhuangia sp. 1_MG-2023]|nr:hypothetical protein [Wenyingzhuangia sp. 1_MG-2023]
MTKFDDMVSRLDRWAAAVEDSASGSRGYARVDWSGSIGGGVGSSGSVDLWTAETLDTDQAVAELPAGPKAAVQEFWLHRDASIEQKCRACRMTRRTL